jgi:hypothetical protein
LTGEQQLIVYAPADPQRYGGAITTAGRARSADLCTELQHRTSRQNAARGRALARTDRHTCTRGARRTDRRFWRARAGCARRRSVRLRSDTTDLEPAVASGRLAFEGTLSGVLVSIRSFPQQFLGVRFGHSASGSCNEAQQPQRSRWFAYLFSRTEREVPLREGAHVGAAIPRLLAQSPIESNRAADIALSTPAGQGEGVPDRVRPVRSLPGSRSCRA